MDTREDNGGNELKDATVELAETLEALREELQSSRHGPLGMPRPPKRSELLRFTEQYTIPTIIALLEAGIKTLELLAAALRVADGRSTDSVSTSVRSGLAANGRDRLATTSQETLRRLDGALAELQSAAQGEPTNPELLKLLEEARALRAEVDERLADAVDEESSTAAETKRSTVTGPLDSTNQIEIDVDDELASIKRSIDDSESDEEDRPATNDDDRSATTDDDRSATTDDDRSATNDDNRTAPGGSESGNDS